MIKNQNYLCRLACFLIHTFFYGLVRGETKPVGFAIPFPDLTFKQLPSKEEQAYLGIPKKTTFSFKGTVGV